MNIVTESGFWNKNALQLCPEIIEYLFKSLADLDKGIVKSNKSSDEINFTDDWYFHWEIKNNEIHISNVHKKVKIVNFYYCTFD